MGASIVTAVAQGMKEPGHLIAHGDFDGQIAMDVSTDPAILTSGLTPRASIGPHAMSSKDIPSVRFSEVMPREEGG